MIKISNAAHLRERQYRIPQEVRVSALEAGTKALQEKGEFLSRHASWGIILQRCGVRQGVLVGSYSTWSTILGPGMQVQGANGQDVQVLLKVSF